MKTIAILLGAAMLAACSGTPTQTQYYLLRTDLPASTRDLSPSKEFAVGRVTVAPYIDQAGLILETGSGEIHPARYHQWAEPMPEALRHVLRVEVSRALDLDLFPSEISEADTFFDVRIDQLHGTSGGEAVLVAYWGVRRGGELIETNQFSDTRALTEDGYGAMARTFESMLVDLSRAIADSLREVSEARP
jgi:uncharacterized lipoprotein YmbA